MSQSIWWNLLTEAESSGEEGRPSKMRKVYEIAEVKAIPSNACPHPPLLSMSPARAILPILVCFLPS